MSQHLLTDIGLKLRTERKAAQLTLVDLAARAGVSKSLLSKIENGRTIPSLPVLLSLIKSLELLPETFFQGLHFEPTNKYIHLKPKDFKPIDKEEEARGFTYQLMLAETLKDLVMEAVILDIEPGAQRAMVSTDAMEFKYLLEGELQYHIEDEVIHLQAGDVLYYDGRQMHVPRNESSKTARMLVLYLYDKAQE
jgi:transcriptional regulator with XRE-family HTH domain